MLRREFEEDQTKPAAMNISPLQTISHNPRAKLIDTSSSLPTLLSHQTIQSANSSNDSKLEYLPLPATAKQNKLNSSQQNGSLASNEIGSVLKNTYEATEVKGPEGQVCESKAVLDSILTKYTHISTNTFKGLLRFAGKTFLDSSLKGRHVIYLICRRCNWEN